MSAARERRAGLADAPARAIEPWFAALKVDLHELATNPTDYDEDVIVPVASDALRALVALTDVADAAEALIERTVTDLTEVGRREVKLSQLLRAARNVLETANSQEPPS